MLCKQNPGKSGSLQPLKETVLRYGIVLKNPHYHPYVQKANSPVHEAVHYLQTIIRPPAAQDLDNNATNVFLLLNQWFLLPSVSFSSWNSMILCKSFRFFSISACIEHSFRPLSLCVHVSHGRLETPLSAHSKRLALQQLYRLWIIGQLFSHSLKCHKWIIHGFKFRPPNIQLCCSRLFLSTWLLLVQMTYFAGLRSEANSVQRHWELHLSSWFKEAVKAS